MLQARSQGEESQRGMKSLFKIGQVGGEKQASCLLQPFSLKPSSRALVSLVLISLMLTLLEVCNSTTELRALRFPPRGGKLAGGDPQGQPGRLAGQPRTAT